MFKPSGILTFTDANGKPHLQILREFLEKQNVFKRVAYEEGFDAARKQQFEEGTNAPIRHQGPIRR